LLARSDRRLAAVTDQWDADPLTDFIVAREQENLAMQLGKLFTQDPARGE
jgi:hypothetical protein